LGHNLNDVGEVHGNQRLTWLDLFSNGAIDVLSGGPGGSAENGGGIACSAVLVGASSNRVIGNSPYQRRAL